MIQYIKFCKLYLKIDLALVKHYCSFVSKHMFFHGFFPIVGTTTNNNESFCLKTQLTAVQFSQRKQGENAGVNVKHLIISCKIKTEVFDNVILCRLGLLCSIKWYNQNIKTALNPIILFKTKLRWVINCTILMCLILYTNDFRKKEITCLDAVWGF